MTRNCGGRGGRVNRDLNSEVVGGGGGRPQVEDTDVGVGGYAGDKFRVVRAEGGGIGAAVGGEGEEGLWTMRRPNAYRAIPTAGAEAVFGDEVPINAEDLACMFFPVLNGVVVGRSVEQLDAAIAGRSEDLVLVDF